MASELLLPTARALDANGNPYNGAKWYFYATGTSTPQNVYSDSTLLTSLGSMVTADSGGKFVPIYFDASLVYRGVLKDSTGAVTLHDIDPINAGVMSALAASGGSALIGFLQSGAGSTARTVQAKLRDTVSVKDFGAVGDGSTDDTTAIQAAVNAAAGAELYFPAGHYKITSSITINNSLSILGVRNQSVIMLATQNMDGFIIGDGTDPTRNATGATSISCIDFNPWLGVATSASGSCIKMNYVYNIRVFWCTFYGKDSGGTVRLFNGITGDRGTECRVINSSFYYLGGRGYTGVGTGVAANRNIDWRFNACDFIGLTGDCLNFGAYSEGCMINEAIAYGYAGNFMVINTTLFNFFINQPNVEVGASAGGIYVQQGSAVQVVGGWFGGGTTVLLGDINSSDIKVSGTRFDQSKIEFRGPACALVGCEVTGASSGTGILVGALATDFVASGNRIRQWANGISFSGSAARAVITGNNFRNNTSDVSGAVWTPATADPAIVKDNVTDAGYSLVAASSVTMQTTKLDVQITGATAINSITVPPYAHEVTVQAGAGGITINNGTILCKGGVNASVPAFRMIKFWSDGGTLIEIARGF